MQGIFGKEFIEKYIGTNEVSLALMTRLPRLTRMQTLEKFLTGKDEKDTVRKLVEYY